ncbi:hypothetical protein B296_00002374, partial [Ensete ventricosum]
ASLFATETGPVRVPVRVTTGRVSGWQPVVAVARPRPTPEKSTTTWRWFMGASRVGGGGTGVAVRPLGSEIGCYFARQATGFSLLSRPREVSIGCVRGINPVSYSEQNSLRSLRWRRNLRRRKKVSRKG